MNAEQKAGVVRPTYAGAFECIGPACEDHCCGGWEIPLDRRTYEAYRRFPPGKLGAVVSEFVTISPAGTADSLYARVGLRSSGLCPFFAEDRLCGVQREYGAGLLSATCSQYPRALNRVGGELEGALSVSCPEAARQVLLVPGFLEAESDLRAGGFRTDNSFAPAEGVADEDLLAVRAAVLEVLRERSRPLAMRLLLAGFLCRELDGRPGAVAAVVEEFRQTAAGGVLERELDLLPRDAAVRAQVCLRLAVARVHAGAGPRLVEVVDALARTMADGVDALHEAEERWCGPLMALFPGAMERYAVNYVLLNLFPYGRGERVRRSCIEEWVLLATQVSVLEVLLAGVAGDVGAGFSADDVVRVVQGWTRAVEHHPAMLRGLLAEVDAMGLGTLGGMALLLR